MAVLVALATALGCGHEPPTRPEDTGSWRVAELPQLELGTSLHAIDFSDATGYILGSGTGKAGRDYVLVVRDPAGNWVRRELVNPPGNALFLDVAAGAAGIAVGGYLQQQVDPCLVHDQRGAVGASIARSGSRIAAIDGDDVLMVAGGTAIGGALWASREPGAWSTEATPLSQLHVGGYADVFVGNGRALACGFDSGSDTPPVVLTLDMDEGTWSRLPLGTGILGRTLRCVAVADDGTVLVGGVAEVGGATPRAFVRIRDASGTWSEPSLPDGDLIGGVNDVLPVGGGVWYVACGSEDGSGLATILRLDANGITRDLSPFHGAVLQLGRDAAGLLHAVGYQLSASASFRLPLLLTRG
ncbi:MAG: hypothetical protein IPK64_03130 [bacterium]|nr:hypothetical protein [bacterium]